MSHALHLGHLILVLLLTILVLGGIYGAIFGLPTTFAAPTLLAVGVYLGRLVSTLVLAFILVANFRMLRAYPEFHRRR